LAAVLVRRISTTNPANDAWLETFRAWWVLQFLQAEARGDKLGRRRTRIGLAIRLCIQETTGRGLWTPVLMELQGADESNRKLHEHLIDYARRTYKQPGCEGSRRDLLRALAYVDAPDDEDREVLSRDAGIPNGAQADSSPYPAWGTISAFSPARPLSAHWLEDLDGFLTDQDDETAVANTSPPVVDIESVAVAVAVPYFDSNGRAKGSLAVFGPSVRMDAQRVDACVTLLKEEGAKLSAALGYADKVPIRRQG
jgi:hypothetical protein